MTSPEQPSSVWPAFSDIPSGEPFEGVPPQADTGHAPAILGQVGHMPLYEGSPDVIGGDGVSSQQETELDPGLWF